MLETTHYTIAQLADEFGITARALRFYEDRGLINPTRNGINRKYSVSDHKRLAWILRGKRVGFSLSEIGELLDLYDLGDSRQTQMVVTLERCRERIDTLTKQREDIDSTIKELTEFCGIVEEKLHQTEKKLNTGSDR